MGHDASEHRYMLKVEERNLANGCVPPDPPQQLLPPLPKSMFDIFRDALESGEPARQELFARRDELVRALKSGSLQSFGIRPGESGHSTIPPIVWETITSIFDDEPGIQVDDIGTLGENGARYHQVRVLVSEVLDLWPRPASSNKAERDCEKWLFDQMIASPLERPKSKLEFKEEALKRFPGLSGRGFDDRVWGRAIEASRAFKWSDPGAPRRPRRPAAKRIESPHLL